MRSQTYITKLWNSACYFLVILTFTFGIDSLEGLTWITKPSQISKCTGQNVTLTWEYAEEAKEEIRQLQWRFNHTKLIAYSSKKNGFHVDPQYQGRVERKDENGILLKNVSAKDIGNYTLYPVIAWEESPNIPSLWLNVIEDITVQQWCTCERLPLSPEWNGGRMFSIVTDGCNLEINSSFCCIKGPAIECMENNPQKLCVPINLTESTTQSRNPNNLTESTTQRRNPNNLTESATQSRIVPEHTDMPFVVLHRTGPIVVQKRNNETERVHLELLVTNTTMISLLVIYCLAHALWRICRKLGQDSYGQKKTEESKSLHKTIEVRLNCRSKPLCSSYQHCNTV